MGQAITVRWSAWHQDAREDGRAPFVAHWDCILPSWADCEGNAQSVVNDICADFFTDEVWQQEFGLEDCSAEIEVEIHSPSSIAGRYIVDLERVTKASARLLVKAEAS